MEFMGRDIIYWIELQARVEEINAQGFMDDIVGLVKENKRLRGRIAYYESRIDQMNLVRREEII
jgi:hypothetical protein